MLARALPLLALLSACAPAEEALCEWPEAPAAPDGVEEASCGWYTLAVGQRLIADVHVAESLTECEYALDEGLSLRSTPIYSALNDEPKYTIDVLAEAAGEGLLVDVTCEDGTRWLAKVDVD